VSWLSSLFLFLISAVVASLQTPARDGLATSVAGTASIAGTVVSDEEPQRPVRRAIVTLSGVGLVPNRSVITDDEGRFVFWNLPSGSFDLKASRASFITSAYGARRPNRPGTTLPLHGGERLTNLVIKLWRGAVVSGVIRDERGSLVEGIQVTAKPMRVLTPSNASLSSNGTTTDERGEYRIFGLEPGTYTVSARPSEAGAGPLYAPSEAEIDATLNALRNGTALPSFSPSDPTSVAIGQSPSDYAPIFYPGTASRSEATPIALTAGQDVAGVDFSLERVLTQAVNGMVTGPDGEVVRGCNVQMVEINRGPLFESELPLSFRATSGPDGRFSIPQVPPGDYHLVAHGRSSAPSVGFTSATSGPGSAQAVSLWAQLDVSADRSSMGPVAVRLEPGLTVTGRVAFSGTAQLPRNLSRTRLSLRATHQAPASARSIAPLGSVAPIYLRQDGTFEFRDVAKGRYRLTVMLEEGTAATWWPRSAILGERDLLDSDAEITGETAREGIIISLTDRHTELSGTLLDSAHAPVSDVFFILYSADRQFWGPSSRRVRAVRPDLAGKYYISDLPPGDYFLCALTDVDQDEWEDPGFLERRLNVSLRISLAEGEHKIQDLRLGSAP